MTTFTPPWLQRLNGIAPLVEEIASQTEFSLHLAEGDGTAALTGSTYAFGDISARTESDIALSWDDGVVEAQPWTFRGCYVLFSGDTDAFEVEFRDPTNHFAFVSLLSKAAVDLGLGFANMSIAALAADDGVEKTMTGSVYTKFSFDGGPIPSGLLGTFTVTKTYNAP